MPDEPKKKGKYIRIPMIQEDATFLKSMNDRTRLVFAVHVKVHVAALIEILRRGENL